MDNEPADFIAAKNSSIIPYEPDTDLTWRERKQLIQLHRLAKDVTVQELLIRKLQEQSPGIKARRSIKVFVKDIMTFAEVDNMLDPARAYMSAVSLLEMWTLIKAALSTPDEYLPSAATMGQLMKKYFLWYAAEDDNPEDQAPPEVSNGLVLKLSIDNGIGVINAIALMKDFRVIPQPDGTCDVMFPKGASLERGPESNTLFEVFDTNGKVLFWLHWKMKDTDGTDLWIARV